MSKQASATARAQQESAWRDRLARHAKSGQTVEAFCRSEAVSAWSFYRWRKLLGAAGRRAASPATKSPARFIDVGAVPVPQVRDEMHAAATAGGIEVRIDLGGGIVLQIARR